MQCIHGDIQEYQTKLLETIRIGNKTFTCRVGVVPDLDCGVLIGRDSHLLTQLLLQMTFLMPQQGAMKPLKATQS